MLLLSRILLGSLLLNTGRYIIYKYYGKIDTIDKNPESEYYIVKWKSESYTFQSYKKLGNDVIKASELVCDAVYLNTLANYKQQYKPQEDKNEGKKLSGYILLL